MGVLGSSAALLLNAVGGIYLLAILLRFLLQIVRADFYNPVSRCGRLTDPMVRIFSFIPGYRGIDFSSLILAVGRSGANMCNDTASRGQYSIFGLYHCLGSGGDYLLHR